MEQRLFFKFYKSYFDTASELSERDRLAFYDAIVMRQFYGVEPTLKGDAKFAYLLQKTNIDVQIKGWEDKTNLKLQLPENHPTQGGTVGGAVGGTVGGTQPPIQHIDIILDNINIEYILNNVRMYFKEKYINKETEIVLNELLKEYDKDVIVKAISWARNDDFWNKNFQSIKKLIRKDKDGVKYIDVFINKMGDFKSNQEQPTFDFSAICPEPGVIDLSKIPMR